MRLGLIGNLLRCMAQVLGPVEHGLVCIDGNEDCSAELFANVKKRVVPRYEKYPKPISPAANCLEEVSTQTK